MLVRSPPCQVFQVPIRVKCTEAGTRRSPASRRSGGSAHGECGWLHRTSACRPPGLKGSGRIGIAGDVLGPIRPQSELAGPSRMFESGDLGPVRRRPWRSAGRSDVRLDGVLHETSSAPRAQAVCA